MFLNPLAEEKLPPHDIEAEEAVIGSLLIDPEAILKIAASLKPGDFYSETDRLIYEACFSLYQRNEAINQMELLGHDFFVFFNAENVMPFR